MQQSTSMRRKCTCSHAHCQLATNVTGFAGRGCWGFRQNWYLPVRLVGWKGRERNNCGPGHVRRVLHHRWLLCRPHAGASPPVFHLPPMHSPPLSPRPVRPFPPSSLPPSLPPFPLCGGQQISFRLSCESGVVVGASPASPRGAQVGCCCEAWLQAGG